MNSLMASAVKSERKSMNMHPCYICKKSFESHWALGGHIRGHRGEVKYWSQSEQHNTSVKGKSSSTNFFSEPQISGHSAHYCEELIAGHNDVRSHLDIVVEYLKSLQIEVNLSMFSQKTLVLLGTQGGLSISSGRINFFRLKCSSPTSHLAPSSGAATGLPKDAFQLGSDADSLLGTGIFEVNEHLRVWQNKEHNHSAQCLPQSLAVGKQVLICGSKFNDCTAVGSVPQDPDQFGGQAEVIVLDLSHEGKKRPFSKSSNSDNADKMNPRKRYKKSSKPPKAKEIQQSRAKKSSPRSVIFPVSQEGNEDLDLSLHL